MNGANNIHIKVDLPQLTWMGFINNYFLYLLSKNNLASSPSSTPSRHPSPTSKHSSLSAKSNMSIIEICF